MLRAGACKGDASMPFKVAVLEDDVALRPNALVHQLTDHGFHVEGFCSSAALYRRMMGTSFELLVLDLKLRDEDGLVIARYLREVVSIGIVMHTTRGSDDDRIQDLAEVVDAWLVKPVDIAVLAATLHGIGRRLRAEANAQRVPPVPPPALWRLADLEWRLFAPNDNSILLTMQERRLLMRMFRAENKLVTHEELLVDLSVVAENYDRHRLETLIYRLRRKVATQLGVSLPLRSVRSNGYVLLTVEERARSR